MNGEPESFAALTLAEVAELPAVVDLLTAARALGIGRTSAYALARGNEFPCPVLRIGGTYRVPTAGLLRVLGVDTHIRRHAGSSGFPERHPQREYGAETS